MAEAVCKEVRCVETGEVFSNAKEAALAKHAAPANLHKCLNGITHTCAGLHWEYTGNTSPIPKATRRDEDGFTVNQRRYMNLLMENPFIKQKEAVEKLGISHQMIHYWFNSDEKFIAAYNRVMDARWKQLQAAAQETMSNLVEEGDFQASKYVLSSLGRDAKQQIEVSAPDAFTINIGGSNERCES